jgi:excisionase family DNA binding protein
MVRRVTFSVAEAAAAHSVSRGTLYAHIKAGRVRTFKFGGRTLIRADDLKRAVDLASGRATEGNDDGDGRRVAKA